MVVAFWEARNVAEAERERTSVSRRKRLNTKKTSVWYKESLREKSYKSSQILQI